MLVFVFCNSHRKWNTSWNPTRTVDGSLCQEKKKECLQSAEIKTSASISSLEFVSI